MRQYLYVVVACRSVGWLSGEMCYQPSAHKTVEGAYDEAVGMFNSWASEDGDNDPDDTGRADLEEIEEGLDTDEMAIVGEVRKKDNPADYRQVMVWRVRFDDSQVNDLD